MSLEFPEIIDFDCLRLQFPNALNISRLHCSANSKGVSTIAAYRLRCDANPFFVANMFRLPAAANRFERALAKSFMRNAENSETIKFLPAHKLPSGWREGHSCIVQMEGRFVYQHKDAAIIITYRRSEDNRELLTKLSDSLVILPDAWDDSFAGKTFTRGISSFKRPLDLKVERQAIVEVLEKAITAFALSQRFEVAAQPQAQVTAIHAFLDPGNGQLSFSIDTRDPPKIDGAYSYNAFATMRRRRWRLFSELVQMGIRSVIRFENSDETSIDEANYEVFVRALERIVNEALRSLGDIPAFSALNAKRSLLVSVECE